MCTVVISVQPASAVPVLLAGVRDEFSQRPWLAPARHWRRCPELIGGLDRLAGGTWLAVDDGHRRVAAILNAFGRHTDPGARLSRGELPLLAASGGRVDEVDLPRYDPFHLVSADLETVTVSTWDGYQLVEHRLGSGLHIVVNSGIEGKGTIDEAPAGAVDEISARLHHFRPLLQAAARPEPIGGTAAQAWGQWLPLVDGGGLDMADPRALVVRRDFGERGIWGTSSISLVGLRPGGVRYDFAANPGMPGDYLPVDLEMSQS
ncbi:hypothetical protein Rhe02_66040 [Rhizocola hellebori]|uniref:NRDE family protein n=1 Tax=Rhizocola hellebori TaxID=1392758 RepID=A0A8J3QEH0_9ACTN|nr:NRDE family protein [Rhizocola hellebori]GIH08537.1 hypothetical protein Rhe02_66040 [Rhizocola hellebori]